MKAKKMIAISLAMLSLGTFIGCNDNESSSSSDKGELNGTYTIWGTNNLTSVVQETDYNDEYEKDEAKLEFFMAKAEQEYDQLIVTSSGAISSIELVGAELTNGENKITQDMIQVFMQKYTYCDDKTQWPGVMGIKDDTAYFDSHYPDMLMNMEVAVAYKENTVEANKNQGFTVRIKTKEDTPSGVYTGNFTLKIGDKTENIPVSVTVWDFALGNATGKSLLYNQSEHFMNGDFDNSVELQRTYYELCLEYDVNPQFFPGYESFLYNQDIDGFVKEIERYWDHPNFTSYCIPNYELASWGQFTTEGKELVKNTFLAIARASAEGKNYFDKLTICHPSLDEPQYSNSYGRVGAYFNTINQLGEETIAQLEKEGYFEGKSTSFVEEMKYSLRNIQQVITSSYTDGIVLNGQPYDQVNGWCPTIENYATQVSRDLYKAEAERTEGEQWFYTCNQPQYPYASHYTHQSPVAHRALKWIQYDLDIEGYLTWFINYNDGGALRNPYTETQVWDLNPNGDGYFFYPGRAYDTDSFPTQKLLTYSDGQEDMDMFNMLEDLFLQVAVEYGMSQEEAAQQYDRMLGHMMDRVIDGATNTFKGEDLLQVRKEAAQMILALQKGELITYSFDGTTANYLILSKSSNVKVNGEAKTATQAADGKYKLVGTVDLTKDAGLNAETDETAVDLFLSKAKTLVVFSDKNVKVSADSTYTVNGSELAFALQSKEDITFETSLKIKIAAFEIENFTQMDNLTFDYTNYSDKTYVLSILLAKNSNTMELERYTIPANSTLTISIPLVYNNKDGYNYERVVGKTDELRFVIVGNSTEKYNGSISKMTFTKEG